MQLSCPRCKSENTQKLSLLVEGGTSKTSTTTFGVGGVGGNMAAGGALSSGVSTSKLAEKNKAPEKIPVIRLSLAILFLAWLISLFAGATAMTIGFLLVVVVAVSGWRYNWTKFGREFAQWDAKFICLRCSNIFEVTPKPAPMEEPAQVA